MLGRMVVTVLGAALLVAGAMLEWVRSATGIGLSYRVFYRTDLSGGAGFLVSAGAVVILLAIIGLVGLTARSGWPIRLAGALGLAAFMLFVIQAIRADVANSAVDLAAGIWLVLLGAVVTLIGGIVGGSRTVVRDE